MFEKAVVVPPLEIMCRRRLLGLDREGFGRCLSLACPLPDGGVRPPVPAGMVGEWEDGGELPVWLRSTMRWAVADILDVRDRMSDRAYEDARQRNVREGGSGLRVRAYASDVALWLDWPVFRGWPHGLWNAAAVVAMDDLAERYGMPVSLLVV